MGTAAPLACGLRSAGTPQARGPPPPGLRCPWGAPGQPSGRLRAHARPSRLARGAGRGARAGRAPRRKFEVRRSKWRVLARAKSREARAIGRLGA